MGVINPHFPLFLTLSISSLVIKIVSRMFRQVVAWLLSMSTEKSSNLYAACTTKSIFIFGMFRFLGFKEFPESSFCSLNDVLHFCSHGSPVYILNTLVPFLLLSTSSHKKCHKNVYLHARKAPKGSQVDSTQWNIFLFFKFMNESKKFLKFCFCFSLLFVSCLFKNFL